MEPFVDPYHIDVSDGHFVPGLLFFPDPVATLRPLSAKPFHVHLIVTNPLDLLPTFLEAGASLITVHVENGPLAPTALQAIRQAGRAPAWPSAWMCLPSRFCLTWRCSTW